MHRKQWFFACIAAVAVTGWIFNIRRADRLEKLIGEVNSSTLVQVTKDGKIIVPIVKTPSGDMFCPSKRPEESINDALARIQTP